MCVYISHPTCMPLLDLSLHHHKYMCSLFLKGGGPLWSPWVRSSQKILCMTSEVSHENDTALAWLSLRMRTLELSEAVCETWGSLPIWRGTDLTAQPSGALSSERQLPAMGLSHFSTCILQSSFELFQRKLLEQRWANFLEQSSPTEPCPNFRFMSKINLYYDPNPLGFGVDCYTIMYSQDNTYTCA